MPMKHQRRWSVYLLLALLPAFIGGLFPHSAAAVVQKQPFFSSTFNTLPTGPLAASSDSAVELGSVYVAADSVEVQSSPASSGSALALTSGAAVAELRFKNYPDTLPPVNGNDPNVNGNDRYDLVIKATLTASVSDTLGAQFGLADGGNFYDLVTFDANGELAQNGTPISATYAVSTAVTLNARLHLASNRLDMTIASTSGTTQVLGAVVPSSFNRSTINKLQFQANGGSGTYTLDDVNVSIERESGPPAVITIPTPEFEYDHEGGFTFIKIHIKIKNSGGSAAFVFLHMDLQEFLELADLDFMEGAGYVVEIKNGQVIIGIGQNNRLDGDKTVELKIKIKIKSDGVKIKIKFTLHYSDDTGDFVQDPIVVEPGDEGNPPPSDEDDQGDNDGDAGDSEGGDNDVPGPTPAPEPLLRLPISHIDIHFTARWEVGGLRIYGYPLTEPITRDDGVIVQYFERVRFEYHPENAGSEYQ